MNKANELRELEDHELEAKIDESRRELFNLRFQVATGRLDNVTRIPTVRREIARLLTITTERAKGVAVGGRASRRAADDVAKEE